jgi:hypothetical protein
MSSAGVKRALVASVATNDTVGVCRTPASWPRREAINGGSRLGLAEHPDRLLVRFATDFPAAVLSNEFNGFRQVVLWRFGPVDTHPGGGVVAGDVDVGHR